MISTTGENLRLLGLYIATLTVVVIGLSLFFGFTAEDSFISLRYARNVFSGHGPIYNHGENINAMTSPLHVFILYLFFYITENTELANKIMGISCAITSAAILARAFRGNGYLVALAVATAISPAPVLLWSVGGLETPLLLLLVTISVPLVLAIVERQQYVWNYLVLCLVGGIAFLVRYDSAIYFGPIILVVAFINGIRIWQALCWITGAIAPFSWIVFSIAYYGDPLPTSFYVKTPSVDSVQANVIYIATFLATTGLALVMLIPLASSGNASHPRNRIPRLQATVLAAGVAMVLLYGLTMATTHMMFQFRFFVPFFGVTAALVALLSQFRNVPSPILFYCTSVVIVAGCASYFQIYKKSLNGFSPVGEYRRLSLQEYETFIATLEANADAIYVDWKKRGTDREPRVYTFAEGVLPYKLNNAYIYGGLVSYRHGSKPNALGALKRNADYVHIVAPRHGNVSAQIEGLAAAELVSDETMIFDGEEQHFQVYWNSMPLPHNLPTTMHGA